LSVAGNQKGIEAGERSSLFFEAIRIIKEMREATNGVYPNYAVWENVCFDQNTLITCENGYRRISDVKIGDKVKTLSGKYLPVLKLHRTENQEVVKIKLSGGEDLIVTPNHPFYAREKYHDKSNNNRIITSPEWTRADALSTKSLIGYSVDTPTIDSGALTDDLAWALGRWLADGSVDLKRSNPRVFISSGLKKRDETKLMLSKLPWEVYENTPHKTAVNFVFTSIDFYRIIENAGMGAANKRVPSEVFNMPIPTQQCVLDGYMSGDGYCRSRYGSVELTATTASRELAYGLCRLIRNCYHIGANISKAPAKDGNINGRILHANYPSYRINATITNKTSLSIYENGIVWQPVQKIERVLQNQTVYNLSVSEDNTYEANSVIVHNCGAFSSNRGNDFRLVLEALARVSEPSVSIPKP
jgi:intein/homing endonuclease